MTKGLDELASYPLTGTGNSRSLGTGDCVFPNTSTPIPRQSHSLAGIPWDSGHMCLERRGVQIYKFQTKESPVIIKGSIITRA